MQDKESGFRSLQDPCCNWWQRQILFWNACAAALLCFLLLCGCVDQEPAPTLPPSPTPHPTLTMTGSPIRQVTPTVQVTENYLANHPTLPPTITPDQSTLNPCLDSQEPEEFIYCSVVERRLSYEDDIGTWLERYCLITTDDWCSHYSQSKTEDFNSFIRPYEMVTENREINIQGLVSTGTAGEPTAQCWQVYFQWFESKAQYVIRAITQHVCIILIDGRWKITSISDDLSVLEISKPGTFLPTPTLRSSH